MKPLLYLAALMAPLMSHAQNLTMLIERSQVDGNQVTYDVRVENFTDMAGMQYGILYDQSVFTFVKFQNMSLIDLDPGDFNPNLPGMIRNVWIDTHQSGITLDDGSLLYQIVFEMTGGTDGNVCFSEDVLESEFVKLDQALAAFTVVDDCHPEPFVIELTSAVDELADEYGIHLATIGTITSLPFRTSNTQKIGFRLIDLSGKVIRDFGNMEWAAGAHTLAFGKALIPGTYVLHVDVGRRQYGVKVLMSE